VTRRRLAAMSRYQWPGNIRELQNCVERAVIVARGSTIDLQDLPRDLFGEDARPDRNAKRRTTDLDGELARIEKAFILDALRETNGVQSKAAKLLGINERSLCTASRSSASPSPSAPAAGEDGAALTAEPGLPRTPARHGRSRGGIPIVREIPFAPGSVSSFDASWPGFAGPRHMIGETSRDWASDRVPCASRLAKASAKRIW